VVATLLQREGKVDHMALGASDVERIEDQEQA
jgi:hypothetical protein